MNQDERRKYLIEELLKEQKQYRDIELPQSEEGQRRLLRSLMNVRMPGRISIDFLKEQDIYLKQINEERGIVRIEDLKPVQPQIYIWKGDITRLNAGAIVNAANSGMTGCYQPCHNCIDNCIHTYAGIQLRNKCAEIMELQGCEEPTGQAKITPAYNLFCDYIIHTVGPIVRGRLTAKHEKQLESCYESCLRLADSYNISSIAFCCISTGVFMFPNERAAQIAVDTVKKYKKDNESNIKVIFNVFKDIDEQIYRKILK